MEPRSLFHAMTREVEARCEARKAAARQEADALVADTEARCAREREEALQAAREAGKHRRTETRARAEAEARQRALAFEDTVAEETLASVERAMADLAAGPDFGPILDALLAQALEGRNDDVQVLAPPAHADRCRRWLDASGRAATTVLPERRLTDGVAVQDPARSFRVTNTLSARYAQLKADARRRCLETLFGSGGES